MPKKRRITVKYSKLGRDGVWGYAHMDDNVVELDSRVYGKKHLELLIHECIHILFPKLGEQATEEKSIMLTNTLWHEMYRRVDNKNEIPLQDGKK